MDLKLKTVERAVATLAALGARYAVEYNGTVFGEPLSKPNGRHRGEPMFDNLAKFNYKERFEASALGDELVFQCASGKEARSLRGSIGSYAITTRGPGSIVTHYEREDNTLHTLVILPVSPQEPTPA